MNVATLRRKTLFRLLRGALSCSTAMGMMSAYAQTTCSSQNGGAQLHLVELYTSEGCDSCPPAEKWMVSLSKHAQFAGLEFHVDYWDSLQWKDPFSNHAYTQRQQALAKRSNHGEIYTPQIWLDGHLWHNWPKGAPPVFAGKPSSTLSAAVTMGTPLRASFDVSNPDGKDTYLLYAAVTENDLERSVTGGENRGKKLRHDSVVRAFAGPLSMPHAQVEFKLPEQVNLAHASVIGFLQDERDGAITQVVRVPLDQCLK